jgi:hypothetical protein
MGMDLHQGFVVVALDSSGMKHSFSTGSGLDSFKISKTVDKETKA